MELRGRKVTIMGLGSHGGGVAAARYCAQTGATVTVADLASEQRLAESLDQLRDVPIARYTLGQHRAEDFESAEVVVVNPAVRPDNDWMQIARTRGAVITSEVELFLDACPAMVVGVTGTVGKSTTAAMLAAILQRAGRRAWLGGNIGNSLLGDLPQMRPDDVVVLELSSFQLHWLSDAAHWPRAAIVTNCWPNHLDWHGTFERYAAAKRRIISHLPSDGFCVLNSASDEVRGWRESLHGCRVLACQHFDGLLGAAGAHNRANAACSAVAAGELGIDEPTIAAALANFKGLPHRLQYLGELSGRHFYNDSKATTPAATSAALESIAARKWLLLGGADVGADFAQLCDSVGERVAGVAVFGTVADRLHSLLRQQHPSLPCSRAESLAEAFAWCVAQSQPGDSVLLSPVCPSTDQFRDFMHRGEEFQQMVAEWRSRVTSDAAKS